ncbi:hypothetical protein H0H93_000841 [Arthromyces matolae]|nr:hypothetical protein H0H93_000841 [Arthromyces matolae]
MGILDTDWVIRQVNTGRDRVKRVGRPAPQSLWDELILRHQREREDLLAWEDNLDPVGSRSQTPTQSQFEVQLKADGDDAKCDKRSPDEQDINTVSASGSEENTLVANSDASEIDSESMSERSSSPGGYSSSHSSSSSASGWSIVDPSESDFDDSFSVDANDF